MFLKFSFKFLVLVTAIFLATINGRNIMNERKYYSRMTHFVIGNIAQHFLTENAKININHYLANFNGSLAEVSIWADQIRWIERWKFTGPYHYVNVDDKCELVYSRDCPNDNCVMGAITNYTKQIIPKAAESIEEEDDKPLSKLLNQKISFENIRDAIRFVVHFVGDMHQPLHVGKGSDRGGNSIEVSWFGKGTNLHSVWDFDIPLRLVTFEYRNSNEIWENHLIEMIENGRWQNVREEWIKCSSYNNSPKIPSLCPEEWSHEIAKVACNVAYEGAPNGAELGEEYYRKSIEPLEELVAQAGYRLAALINQAFDNNYVKTSFRFTTNKQ